MTLAESADGAIPVSDRYMPDSLKSRARQKTYPDTDYQVTDETSNKHQTISRVLAHDKTKAEFTEYMTGETLDYSKSPSKLVTFSAAECIKGNKNVGTPDENNHDQVNILINRSCSISCKIKLGIFTN